jgi:acyl-CoA oxidase
MAPTRFPRHLKPIEPQGQELLQQERANASFDIKHLTEKIYGKPYLDTKKRILSVLANDPILGDKSHRYYTGRNIRFKKAMAAAKRMAELIK